VRRSSSPTTCTTSTPPCSTRDTARERPRSGPNSVLITDRLHGSGRSSVVPARPGAPETTASRKAGRWRRSPATNPREVSEPFPAPHEEGLIRGLDSDAHPSGSPQPTESSRIATAPGTQPRCGLAQFREYGPVEGRRVRDGRQSQPSPYRALTKCVEVITFSSGMGNGSRSRRRPGRERHGLDPFTTMTAPAEADAALGAATPPVPGERSPPCRRPAPCPPDR
jgi:hypothetical protein